MAAGGTHIVGAGSTAEGGLGRNQHFVTASGDGFAENFLSHAVGINIRAIEHGESGIEADIDQARRLLDSTAAPCSENLAFAAKSARPQSQHRHVESRSAKLSIFHKVFPEFSRRAATNSESREM